MAERKMTSSGVVWELIHQKPNATAAAMIAENVPVPRQNHRRNNVTAAKLVGRSFGE